MMRFTGLLFLLGAAHASCKAQQLDVTAYGIKPGDGKADAVGINKLIRGLRNGGTLYFPAGTYDLEEPVVLKSGVTLRGQSPTGTIFRQTGSIAGWQNRKEEAIITTNRATRNEDVHVQQLTMTGIYTKTIGEKGRGGKGGICLRNCRSSSIRNVVVKDVWLGAAFYDYDFNDANSGNVIERAMVYRARNFYNPGNSGSPRGILITTPRGLVKDCTATGCGTGFFASGEGIRLTGCTAADWTIDNGYYIIVNNLEMDNCKAITGTTKKQGLGSGFAVAYSRGGNVVNCVARNCANYGFRIHVPQSDLVLRNNVAERCGIGFGIENANHPYPEMSEGLQFLQNISVYSSQQGFLLRQMKNGLIKNNTARNNNQNGVSLSTKGGIAILDHFFGCTIEDNICDDTQQVKTQVFGLVDYNKQETPAVLRKSGSDNRIRHSSRFGKDDF